MNKSVVSNKDIQNFGYGPLGSKWRIKLGNRRVSGSAYRQMYSTYVKLAKASEDATS
jgi:hypothetical protein